MRRQDQCKCGNLKSAESDKCLPCFKQEGIEKRAKRRTCKCGGKKAEKSPQCMKCHLAEITPISDGKITCTRCYNNLDTDSFYKHGNSKRSVCIECCRKISRRRNIITKCIKYGLSKDQAEQVAILDSIKCYSCGEEVSQFHIDHCHKTNKYRGLLCSNCNSGLGLFNDSIERLQMAIVYLQTYGSLPSN